MNASPKACPIPARLNMVTAATQLVLLCSLLISTRMAENPVQILMLAAAYGIVMNSAYAMIHEAEHNLFHPTPFINTCGGVILALFFPAPYHLIRQGHIGHHLRNRSDDEAFDLYFEGENRVWKHLQYYGILTGLFWVVIALSNFIALIYPKCLTTGFSRKVGFDRPTEALIESLNPKYGPLIQLEALALFLLHGSLIYFLKIPLWHYGFVLFGFGYSWSALQYLHHYGTERHVLRGARNVRSFKWLDKVLLNHNWHLIHHLHPTVSWVYLPRMEESREATRESMVMTYLNMWKGPRLTEERVSNRYVGRVIR